MPTSPITPSKFNSGSIFIQTDLDPIEALLEDKRSESTKRTYRRSLFDFFTFATGEPPTPESIEQFLQLPQSKALALATAYKVHLRKRGLKENTINVRLTALKSLVKFARRMGRTKISLDDLQGEKVVLYRDTTGVSPQAYRKMLDVPDPETMKGKRDRAILRLLWDNALRRGEIAGCDVGDFDGACNRLQIYGKGRGGQSEWVDLACPTYAAIATWLDARNLPPPSAPLFINLDRANKGTRLSTTSIYKIVRSTAAVAGIPKLMSPHRVRHSSITAALDATDGNVREVQRLSRHRNLETLTRYDDNRKGHQKKVSDLLSQLV